MTSFTRRTVPTTVATVASPTVEKPSNCFPMFSDKNQWFVGAMETVIQSTSVGQRYTGEDIRKIVSEQFGNPVHHNCWGAFVLAAVKNRLLLDTGDTAPMQSRKAHGRRTPIYERMPA